MSTKSFDYGPLQRLPRTCWLRRYSMKAENSVNDLIESLQQLLSQTELEKMMRPETGHHETDAYTAFLNYFTQKNTDALIKCTLFSRSYCIWPSVLPIHFFRHFCCRMYHSAATHSEKPNRRNFPIWNSHGQRDHVAMAIPDAAFSAVPFCSYTVRRMQYDRPS